MKTMEDWKGSIYDYLKVGDQVEEAMVDHFRNIMMPLRDRQLFFQFAEPYSHVNGRATFLTFEKIDGVWTYKGNCHCGETEEPMPA